MTSTLDCGLKHPLGFTDDVEGAYFDLELHFSDDFVSARNEMIDPVDALCDDCGQDLAYEPDVMPDTFGAGRIRRSCPKCSSPFRPQDHVVVFRDGMTGQESELKGGATYRFAIVVDCGKCWRTDAEPDAPPVATSEFLDVSSRALSVPLSGVGHFY